MPSPTRLYELELTLIIQAEANTMVEARREIGDLVTEAQKAFPSGVGLEEAR